MAGAAFSLSLILMTRKATTDAVVVGAVAGEEVVVAVCFSLTLKALVVEVLTIFCCCWCCRCCPVATGQPKWAGPERKRSRRRSFLCKHRPERRGSAASPLFFSDHHPQKRGTTGTRTDFPRSGSIHATGARTGGAGAGHRESTGANGDHHFPGRSHS